MFTRRQNAAGYAAIMGSIKSAVVIGGRSIAVDKFVPAMNLSAHNDEAWVDINHDSTPMADISNILESDGIIRHRYAAAKLSHALEARQSAEHGEHTKWNIEYDSAGDVPSTINFRIRHSKNLTFHKQPDVLEDGGVYICPEAAGSYAVYMDKENGGYKTGKVMHLYSGFFICEATDERSPLLRMVITPDVNNAKRLTMFVDDVQRPEIRAWLDDPLRTGKIILDPTLGYDVVGASSNTVGALVWYTHATQSDGTGGQIQSIHCALAALGGASEIKMAVGNCIQSGNYELDKNNILVAQGKAAAVVTDDLVMGNLVISEPVLPNTFYRVGAVSDANASYKRDILTAEPAYWYAGNYPLEMQDTVASTGMSNSGSKFSFWSEYEFVDTGKIPPHLFGRVR